MTDARTLLSSSRDRHARLNALVPVSGARRHTNGSYRALYLSKWRGRRGDTPGWARTSDPPLRRRMLCPLSYGGIW